MRKINITYKDPNYKGKISKIELEVEIHDNKKVIKEIEGLTKKGIYSINIREIKKKDPGVISAPIQTAKEKKEEFQYLKY